MADRPDSPLLRASTKVDWSKGADDGRQRLYGAGKDQQYSVAEVADLPAGILLNKDVWKKADQIAQAQIMQRRIELVAQEFGPENPVREMLATNMTNLAKQYPNLDPDALIGIASGWATETPDPGSPQIMSDQGQASTEMFDEVHIADVLSRIDQGTYGATQANPFPTMDEDNSLGGLAALEGASAVGMGQTIVPEGAEPQTFGGGDFGAEEDQGLIGKAFGTWLDVIDNPVDSAKQAINFGQNVLRATPELQNAATEVSFGNEQKAAELARRANMTEEQARELFGDRGLPDIIDKVPMVGPILGVAAGRYTTDIDPAQLAAQIEHSPDDSIPIGDITFEQAQDLWLQHLQETEQVSGDGSTNYGSLTGRTTLGQQARNNTVGEGGWFGGGTREEEDAMEALAGRQSDVRSFEERQRAEERAAKYQRMYKEAGIDLTLDELTRLKAPRPWTEGRATTAFLGASPGSLVDKTVSGMIDVVFTLGQDPTSYIPLNAPSGVGKTIVSGVTKGRFFSLDEAARKSGENIVRVGQDLQWVKEGRTYRIADETGQVVANSPRIVREGYEWVADTGHKVVRNGRRWEVHTPEYIADPQNAPAPQQFGTKREAVDSLAMPVRKKERWREENDTNPGVDLEEAQKAVQTDYVRATGIMPKAVLSSQHVWDYLRDSEQGGQFVNAMVNNNDAYNIWLRSGRQFSIDLSNKLAQAQTAPEVLAIMAERLGPDMRATSGIANFVGAKGRLVDAKIRMANSEKVSGLYRLSELAPKGTPVRLDDLDDLVAQTHALGTAMGLKPEQMRDGINAMINAGGGKAAADYMQGDLLNDVFRQGLLAKGVRPARVDRLMDKIIKERAQQGVRQNRATSRRAGVPSDYDEMAANALETRMGGGPLLDTAIPDGQFLHGVNDEAALFGQEVLGTHIMMPGVRDIRREVSLIARAAHRNSDESDDAFDKIAKTASKALDTWRNLTLANASYINRSIVEELFRMGMLGRSSLLTHPVQALSMILAVHHAGEYSSGFRGVTRSIDRAKSAMGAERAARLRPEEYRGVRMVETEEVFDALGLADQQFDDAVGKSGFRVPWRRFLRQTRRGIIDPVEVTVDYTTQRVKVGAGARRLQAARENGLDSVPVRIVPGRVADTEGEMLSDAMILARRQRQADVAEGAADVRHDDLFHRNRVHGDIGDVVAQARAAVNDSIAFRMGMKYVWPKFSSTLGRANGDTYLRDVEDAVRAGDNTRLTRAAQLLTRLNGSALIDEHPNKTLRGGAQAVDLRYDANGAIDWSDKNSRHYVNAVADSLADIAAVPEVRAVLNGKPLDDIVNEVLDDPERLEDIMAVLSDGIEYSVGRAGANIPEGMTPEAMIEFHMSQMRGAPEQAVRGYFQNMMDNVARYMGNNAAPDVREVVRSAYYAGKPLGSNNRKFVDFLKAQMEDNGDFVAALPPQMRPLDRFSEGIAGKFVTGFFNFAGNMRDMITLQPLLRQVYVEEIVRLGKYLEPDEHAAMVKNLRDIGDDKSAELLSRVRPSDNGWMSVEMAERLADDHARRTAEDEFYHAMNRNNWAAALRWASPFAQAAANSTRLWGRAMVKNPLSVYRTVRNVEAIQDSVSEFVGNNDPEGLQDVAGVEGWLDRNQYGEDMFVYPGVGMVGNLIGNLMYRGISEVGDKYAATATNKSVDLFQSGIVSTGPVLNFMIGMTPLRNLEARPDIFGDIMRYIQPYGVPQEGNPVTRAMDAFLPAKWAGAVWQDDKMINALSKTIVTSRISSGEYGPMSTWDQQTSDKIRADVNRDARTLLTLESISKIGLPLLGGFSFSPLIEMPQDMRISGIPDGKEGVAYLLPHMLQAEFQRYMEGATSYEDRQNRQAVFMRDWGDFAQHLQYGSTESTSGITYSNPAAMDFSRVEPGLYQEYRDSIGYLFPGGDWDSEWEQYDQAMRAKDRALGVFQERTTTDQWNFVRTKALAWQKQQERKELERNGASYEQLKALDDAYDLLGLHQQSSGWTERHMANIQNMVNDDRVTTAVQTARYIKEYMKLREQTRAALRAKGYESFNSDTAHEDPTVQWLYVTGSKAAAEDPGFGNFWENLAVNEFMQD